MVARTRRLCVMRDTWDLASAFFPNAVAYQNFPYQVDSSPQGPQLETAPSMSSLYPKWRPLLVDASTSQLFFINFISSFDPSSVQYLLWFQYDGSFIRHWWQFLKGSTRSPKKFFKQRNMKNRMDPCTFWQLEFVPNCCNFLDHGILLVKPTGKLMMAHLKAVCCLYGCNVRNTMSPTSKVTSLLF